MLIINKYMRDNRKTLPKVCVRKSTANQHTTKNLNFPSTKKSAEKTFSFIYQVNPRAWNMPNTILSTQLEALNKKNKILSSWKLHPSSKTQAINKQGKYQIMIHVKEKNATEVIRQKHDWVTTQDWMVRQDLTTEESFWLSSK